MEPPFSRVMAHLAISVGTDDEGGWLYCDRCVCALIRILGTYPKSHDVLTSVATEDGLGLGRGGVQGLSESVRSAS